MAKILDKIRPSSQQRLLPLQRNDKALRAELEHLPQLLREKKEKQLTAYGRKLNKRLEKSAFAACDKEAYAQHQLLQELQRYDVKQYLAQRAVNHGCAKAIFSAIARGEAWQGALETQKQQMAELAEKRKAYCQKLQEKKQAFLAKNDTADAAAYEREKAQCQALYEAQERKLEAEYQAKLESRSRKLHAQIAAGEAKMAQIRAAAKDRLTLGEDVLLHVDGLKMYFGGLKAVDDISFDVKKGEIFGLIGPNGAGKTTVFNCITRFYDATDGRMHFENKQGEVVDLRHFQVHDVILQGITRTFQNVELVRELSVLDNLLVACTREYRSNLAVQALGLPALKREEQALREKAKRVLKFMGLESYTNWLAFGLPYGILKKVEIARALMSDAKLIIMDEPAAGLNDSETAELTETIRRIRDEFHVTILLVEHDMSLVMNVCDTVCAISFGKMLAIGSSEEIKRNKAVQEAYLGVEEDA